MLSTTDQSGPLMDLLDRIISDPAARTAAKLELCRLGAAQLPEAANPAPNHDRWTSRARPSFLYVMYVLLLWTIPMGLIAAIRPVMASNMAAGMSAYLNAIPEPLYALFGTGYLGYTVARTWGKTKGADR